MDLLLIREGRRFTLYSLEIGKSVGQFIATLEKDDPAEHARMMRRLESLSDRGASRRKDEFNNLGHGLYEAKSKGGGRIVFFYDTDRVVICALGFAKKTRKTPKSVKETAGTRKILYEKHKSSGQGFSILIPEGVKDPRRIP